MFKDIIFFRYKLLSEQLKNDEVGELLAVKYMIFSAVLAGSVISIPVNVTPAFFEYASTKFIISITDIIIAAIINVIGIWYLYHANSQGDGRDFFKRIVCLSFTVSFYIIVIYGVPAYVLVAIFIEPYSVLNRLSVIIFMTILQIFYFRINYGCLLFISGSSVAE